MYAETPGCMYADFGCMYAETLGCMYADFVTYPHVSQMDYVKGDA